MKRCVILDDYQGAALDFGNWDSLSGQVETESLRSYIGDQDELVSKINDADILVIMRERTPFPAELLQRLPKLQLLVTTGMRNASIDMAAAKARGIVVCGTATSGSPPIELTWALILGLARQVVTENVNLRRNGPWQSTVGADLHGRMLGILGLGKIGTQIARVGEAFGMKVMAWSPNLTEERAAAAGAVRAASKEELLEQSDFVTVHLVLSPTTRGLLGKGELRRMRPSAFLVNTSRAAIIDQAALVQALEENWIAGAGLDVFDVEPLPQDHPFRRLPNVLATPHLGYVSQANYRTFFGEAVEDIKAWLGGSSIRTVD